MAYSAVRDILIPDTGPEFEKLIARLASRAFELRNVELVGRSGQRQKGVDVVGQRPRDGAWIGFQCKNERDGTSVGTLRSELGRARAFLPALSELVLATTAPRDAVLQEAARKLTQEHAGTDWPVLVRILSRDDLQEMADGNVALLDLFSVRRGSDVEAVLAELRELAAVVKAGRSNDHVAVGDVPDTILSALPALRCHETTDDERYVIRTAKHTRLDAWAGDRRVRSVSVTGLGGAGKTSLVGYWMEHGRASRNRSFAVVFYWSFYAEPDVMRLMRRLSGFLMERFDLERPDWHLPADEVFEKLAPRCPAVLLVLDGLEVLQHDVRDGPAYGHFTEPLLRDLIDTVGRFDAPWLVVMTSRYPLAELQRRGTHRSLELVSLETDEAIRVLERAGVLGKPAVLSEVSNAFDGHPLALRLFAASIPRKARHLPAEHLTTLLGGLPAALELGAKLKRLVRFYSESLDRTQRALLRALSVFQEPVPAEPLRVLVDTFAEGDASIRSGTSLQSELGVLRTSGVLVRDDHAGEPRYSCHPVVRDSFLVELFGGPDGFAAVDLLADRPGALGFEKVSLEPVIVAIEGLMAGGREHDALRLYHRRLRGGKLFAGRGQPFEAVRVYNALLEPRRPGYVPVDEPRRVTASPGIAAEVLVPAVEFDLQSGELDRAARRLHHAEALLAGPQLSSVHRLRARECHNRGDLAGAVDHAERAVRSLYHRSYAGVALVEVAFALGTKIRALVMLGDAPRARSAIDVLAKLRDAFELPETRLLEPMSELMLLTADPRTPNATSSLGRLRREIRGVNVVAMRLEASRVLLHAELHLGGRRIEEGLDELCRETREGRFRIRFCQATVLREYARLLRGDPVRSDRLEDVLVTADAGGFELVAAEVHRVIALGADDADIAEHHAELARSLAERHGYAALEQMFRVPT